MKIIGAAVENCVHVAGIISFLGIARSLGHETIFLGPAVPVEKLLGAAVETKADMVAVSYRLTPAVAERIFEKLEKKVKEYRLEDRRFVFGGTPSVAEAARRFDLFEKVFSDEGQKEITFFLKGEKHADGTKLPPGTLLERIKDNSPYPLIRHHFGLPTIDETVRGIEKISDSKTVDVISLAPDQNAQQFFFEPEKMKRDLDGSGGTAVRSAGDLEKLREAARRGNYPLMRAYSGTTHIVEMAETLKKTIDNAWAAIPLSWYNELDGRSERAFTDAVEENMKGVVWNAKHGIPVEINEPHQWGLRSAHDSIFVAMAYISAYVAKKLGVGNYVAQYMMNTPPGLDSRMDLAKMLAAKELIKPLISKDFNVITEVRPGLMAFPGDLDEAKGQLAFSIAESMYLHPQIVHVVAFTEANHAASPEDVIQSSKIAKRVVEESLKGLPDIRCDERLTERIEILKEDAAYLIDSIRQLSKSPEPLLDPYAYRTALEFGYLDTPNFVGSAIGRGWISTAIIDGACEAVDPKTGKTLRESQRIDSLKKGYLQKRKPI